MRPCDLPAGAQVPVPHSHDGFEETVYGLSGVTVWTVDGVPAEVGPGYVLCIPRGAVHGFAVGGDADASILCIATPGLFGPGYFREVAAAATASRRRCPPGPERGDPGQRARSSSSNRAAKWRSVASSS